jgi:hypothetical protein
VHVFAHAVPAALHAYGAHDVVVAEQPFLPSHAFVVSVAPVQLAAPQSPSGSVPAIVAVHTPSDPGTPDLLAAHAWHLPAHVALQQTPSTQLPDAHCEASAHWAPFDCLDTHAPPLHQPVASQSLDVVQALPHALPAALHANGAHVVVEIARQAPEPLQTCPFAWSDPVHVWPGHSTSGSVPSLMKPQMPSPPVPFLSAEHAWQGRVHAVVQHTPSTQFAPLHSCAPPQLTPGAFFATQLPDAQ